MNKYHSNKAYAGGYVFDSRKEARRYNELKWLEQIGDISDLRRQVKFVLIPAQREQDTKGARGGIKKGKIIADFVYKDKDGNYVVEDTKGFKTPEYILKRKMMLYFHGIKIKEV